MYDAGSGCGFEVIEGYRNEGIGADLIMVTLHNDEYDFLLGAGLTQMACALHRKLRYHLFEVPQYVKILNFKYVLRHYALKGKMWNLVAKLGNCGIKILDIPNKIRINRIDKRFIIRKETIIPEWVSAMVANDGHQFMEVHDREWFQWNLDYNTYGFDVDIQSFYSVLDRNNKPLGFFMTKERLIQKSGPDQGLIRGTVVEWESSDKSVLSEADINLLAIQTFSKNVDAIFTLACESNTANQLKSMGFRKRAPFIVSIKDKKKQLENIGDQNQWRLRYGMTHMIIL